ncbi:hypothetical protein BDF14DRAFT_1811061 [Spinellus fusiger]|nr:hypothetical protein BDF14DRAFT_1811061 [Spinellus fusiger]
MEVESVPLDLVQTRWARQAPLPTVQRLPPAEACTDLRLLFAIERSILKGEYITDRLFVPKAIWSQSNVRLNSLDTKIATCEALFWNLTRLEAVSDHANPLQNARLLGALEEWLKCHQIKLHKKLNHKAKKESGEIKSYKRQSITTWSNKLSRSMARVNDTFGLTLPDAQYQVYIDSLIRLFDKIHILGKTGEIRDEHKKVKEQFYCIEQWYHHYTGLIRTKVIGKTLERLKKICILLGMIISECVLPDVGILLSKWIQAGEHD